MNQHGSTGLTHTHSSKIVTDRLNLDSGSATFQCLKANWASLKPAIGSVHPYAGHMACERITTTFAPGYAVFECEYAGCSAVPPNTEVPIYEIEKSCSEEPIETHPKFVSTIGGKPSSVLHGATFKDYETGEESKDDARGVFNRFTLLVGGARNPYAGCEKYLDAGVIYSKSWAQNGIPTVGTDVGHIATPSGAPTLDTGRNWLYIGMTVEKRGNSYKVKQSWRASGANGWISAIYS